MEKFSSFFYFLQKKPFMYEDVHLVSVRREIFRYILLKKPPFGTLYDLASILPILAI